VADLKGIYSREFACPHRDPGVGRKIAERLVVELRDRISKTEGTTLSAGASTLNGSGIRSEALLDLHPGVQPRGGRESDQGAVQESLDAESSVEALIKAALRHAAGDHRMTAG